MKPLVLIFVIALVMAVFAVMVSGLWQMAQDGPEKRKKSNKMMQWRIVLQASVLLILALFAALS